MAVERHPESSSALRQAMSLRVRVRDEAGPCLTRLLTDAPVVIGRAPDADLRLDHDTVSRRHAEVLRDPFGLWWIRDLSSHNGTRYQNQRIREKELRPGDAIHIGKFTLAFEATGETAVPAVNPPAVPTVADTTAMQISTLDEGAPPKVSASLLSRLMELEHELDHIEDPGRRLEALCRFMVRGEMRGQMAVALRLFRAHPDQPAQFLCQPQSVDRVDVRRQHISRTLLQRLLSKDTAVLGSNTGPGRDQVALSLSPDQAPLSAVACPLDAGEEFVDLLYVTFPPQCALPEWLALTKMAAEQFHQARMAIQAREHVRRQGAVDEELRRAQVIQQRLIPNGLTIPGLDVAVGLEPCRWVGGDYADVVAMPDGRVFLGVADVCGKGLQAAMLCMSLHTLVRSGLRHGPSLGDLVAGINEQLAAYLPESSFVTLAAAMVDPSGEQAQYVNAGHPPVLVGDAHGVLRQLPSATDLPLGIGSDPITVHPVGLCRGEVLTMFTDGWSELRDPEGQMLGIQRVQECVRRVVTEARAEPAATLVHRMATTMDQFRGHRMPGDDRTILVARRR
jgi:phosphoserine phosphatase RsbU/P